MPIGERDGKSVSEVTELLERTLDLTADDLDRGQFKVVSEHLGLRPGFDPTNMRRILAEPDED